MRAREILSEAGRNVATGTTRALLFGLLLAAVGAGLAIVDARSIIAVERTAADFVDSGATIKVLVAKHMTDPAACEHLAAVAGVRAAGSLRESDALTLRAMIANPIPAYAVTPGLIGVLGGDPAARAGAWISRDLAQTLGVRPGQELATTTGTVTVAGTYAYPDDGRDSRLAYAALLPEPATGTFDECWADVWPLSRSREQLLHSALTVDAVSTDPVTIGQLNTSRGTRFDGLADFADRPTRYALPGCALAGLLLGFVAVRVRKLEIAGALHLGESRGALLATLLVETAIWASAAFVLAACALAVGVVTRNPGAPLPVYLIDVRVPAAAAVTTLTGALLALLSIRERHLFRYFKSR
jgi:hypothetical protein